MYIRSMPLANLWQDEEWRKNIAKGQVGGGCRTSWSETGFMNPYLSYATSPPGPGLHQEPRGGTQLSVLHAPWRQFIAQQPVGWWRRSGRAVREA